MTETGKRVLALLDAQRLSYQRLSHTHVTDSASAAQARGTALEIGVKALLIKASGQFYMLTMAADRQLKSGQVRRLLGTQKLRFATAEELLALAGVEKGALPPIGRLFDIPQFVDRSVLANQQVAFTCGAHTSSILMQTADLLRVIDYQIGDFTQPQTPT